MDKLSPLFVDNQAIFQVAVDGMEIDAYCLWIEWNAYKILIHKIDDYGQSKNYTDTFAQFQGVIHNFCHVIHFLRL